MLQNNYNNYQNDYLSQAQQQQPQPAMQQPQPAVAQPGTSANAVSINIYSPQAFAGPANGTASNPYSLYGQNQQPNLPIYPQNYNNLIQGPQTANNPLNSANPTQAQPDNQAQQQNNVSNNNEDDKKSKKTKKIVPITDEYVQSLENYLNNNNPKIRLIGAKELLERLKEDENRKDNPSLIPLVNKTLKDTSAAVRFLGLTMLQLGYCTGNDETVQLLQQIQTEGNDKQGEDALLASEILLKMASPDKVERELTPDEIAQLEEKQNSKQETNSQESTDEEQAVA